MSTNQGLLGKGKSEAGQFVTVYQVPEATVTTATISLVNTGTVSATVKLFISSTATPEVVDAIEYNALITPGGVLQHTCMPAGAGERIIVQASSNDIVIRVAGFEAPALGA